MKRTFQWIVVLTLFAVPALGEYGRYDDDRPWWERVRLHHVGYNTVSISGVKVPEGVSRYYYTERPKGYEGPFESKPVFLYSGNSIRDPLGRPAPPHLAVRDPRDLPPTYRKEVPRGTQTMRDLTNYHGTSIIWSRGGKLESFESETLHGFMRGNTSSLLSADAKGGLRVNGKSVDLDFGYEESGKYYNFKGTNLANIRSRYREHLQALVVRPRRQFLEKMVRTLNVASGNEASSPGLTDDQLAYPFKANGSLKAGCGEYEFVFPHDQKLEIRRKGTRLFEVARDDLENLSFRCFASHLVVQANVMRPLPGLDLSAVNTDSDVKLEDMLKHDGAVYFLNETKLILGKRPLPATSFRLSRLKWGKDTPAGVLFELPVPSHRISFEIKDDGTVIKRPHYAYWECESDTYRIQYISDYRAYLTQVKDGKETRLAELEGMEAGHCGKGGVVVLAQTLQLSGEGKAALKQSNLAKGKRFAGGDVSVFAFEGTALTVAYEVQTVRTTGVRWGGDAVHAQFADNTPYWMEIPLSGNMPRRRPLVQPLDKDCETVGFRVEYLEADHLAINRADAQGETRLLELKGTPTFLCKAQQLVVTADAIVADHESLGQVAVVDLQGVRTSLKEPVEDLRWEQGRFVARDRATGERLDLGSNKVVRRPEKGVPASCAALGFRYQISSQGNTVLTETKNDQETEVGEWTSISDIRCDAETLWLVGRGEGEEKNALYVLKDSLQLITSPQPWLVPASLQESSSGLWVWFEGVSGMAGQVQQGKVDLRMAVSKGCEAHSLSLQENAVVQADTPVGRRWIAGLRAYGCHGDAVAISAHAVAESKEALVTVPEAGSQGKVWIFTPEGAQATDHLNCGTIEKMTGGFRLKLAGNAVGIDTQNRSLFPRALRACGGYGLTRSDSASLTVDWEGGEPLTLREVSHVHCEGERIVAVVRGLRANQSAAVVKTPLTVEASDWDGGSFFVLVERGEVVSVLRAPEASPFSGLTVADRGWVTAVGSGGQYLRLDPEGWFELRAEGGRQAVPAWNKWAQERETK